MIQSQNRMDNTHRSFFMTDIEKIKAKVGFLGDGDFSITMSFTNRFQNFFNKIDIEPTFVFINFKLDEPWEVNQMSGHMAMPYRVETYNEAHDHTTDTHEITISGRTAFTAMMASRVIQPALIYTMDDDETGFYPWELACDIFSRNINGDNKQDLSGAISGINEGDYLTYKREHTDPRYIPNVHLLHEGFIFKENSDVLLQPAYHGDIVLDVLNKLFQRCRAYIDGKIHITECGVISFVYTLKRLKDLRIKYGEKMSTTPLIYDYNAMPPKNHEYLLSIQEEKDIVYVKTPDPNEQDNHAVYTVSKGNIDDNDKYFGWNRREMFNDATSLPLLGLDETKFNKMMKLTAADNLYADENMKTDAENIEYYYTPLRYYINCWPGCIYTNYGTDEKETQQLITAFMLTGSKRDGWLVTPELSRYKDIYEGE